MSTTGVFRVAVDVDTARNASKRSYPTADAAEVSARRHIKGHGGRVSIYYIAEGKRPEWIADVLKDNLGKVWTEVGHAGGRFL